MSTQTDFPTGSQKPIAREFGYINLGGAEFPDQSGHSGEVLTTDGTTVSWTPATGTGTVTSVDFTGPTGFTVSGNPIVGAGTIVLTANSQSAAKFYGSPASTTGIPDFRVLAATDIPFLAASKINSGIFNTAQLGSGTADNTKFLRGDNTWQTVPQGSVTSVDMTVPSIFSIGGNPITSSGILALTLNNQAQNVILAGPASGSGAVTFRALAPSDIPSLAFSKITGTVPLNQGGTGQTTQAPAFNALAPSQASNSGKYLTTDGTNATWGSIALTSGTVTSIGISVPSILTVSNTPITSSGVIAIDLASANPNVFLGGPDATSGTPTFRGIIPADVPSLDAAKITSGVFGTARLGTGTADTTKFLRGDGSWQVNPLGTVTSVTLTVPSALFATTGSPITGSGILDFTINNQSANTVWSGPTSGSSATPTFRALVPADIPGLDAAKIITGTFTSSQIPGLDTSKITSGVFAAGFLPTIAVNKGGTGQTTANDAFNALAPSQTSANGLFLKSNGTDASWSAITIGGSNTQVQYNNAGVPGGITGVTSDGTKFTTLTAVGSISLNASGSTSTNINTGSSTGATNIGNSGNTGGVSIVTQGTVDRTLYTPTISSFSYIGKNYLKKSSGTVSSGFGVADAYYADTDSGTDRIMGGTIWEWSDATDATRSSKVSFLITKNAVPAPRFTFNQNGEFGIVGSTSGTLSIKAAATTNTHTLVFPDTQGGSNTYLKNDGSGNLIWDTPSGGGGDMVLASVQTVTGAKTFGGVGAVGKFILAGSTSGTTILNAAATAGSGTVVLPTTGTLSTLDGTETFTNKTLTSPVLTTPTLGIASATTINKITLTAPAAGATLTLTDGKTLAATNTITLSGTDSTTMTFPATSASVARIDAAQTFTGVQTFSSTIVGSINGNAATVTNATLTTALTVNTGTVQLKGNAANTSTLTIGAGAVSVSGTNTGDQTTVTGNAGTATALQNARTIGGTSFDGTANITVATATGGFTVSGGNLVLGTNSLTLTGSIASTGSRVTKGWFTDLESTNAITINGSAVYFTGGTDVAIADGGTGQSTANAGFNALVPSQTSNSGKYLTTDGTNTSWATISGGGSTNNVIPTCRMATTAALPANTYLLGVLTAVATGALVIDGVTAATNDVVLVKNEATGANNGPYTVTNAGGIGVAYILTRHASMDATGEFVGGVLPIGPEGTANKNTMWRCTNATAPTVGTTAITFEVQYLGAATATSINGLTLTASTGTLSITNAKTLSATNTLTLSGTDSTTMTFPATTATIARTDAAQTFSGTQTFGGTVDHGSNSITLTGSIAATGSRVTKGWFTDIEVTNAPTVGGSAVYYTGGTDVAVADGGTGKSSWTQWLIPYADTTTSFAQIAIGTSGQILTSNGAGAAPTFQTSSANTTSGGQKTADQSVTSSTTLVDATGLSVTVAANSTYNFELDAKFTANSSGGLKWAFTVPAGASGFCIGSAKANFSAVTTTDITTGAGSTAVLVDTTDSFRLSGYIATSSTAGTLQFQFAQNASTGTATIIKKGSTITGFKTA